MSLMGDFVDWRDAILEAGLKEMAHREDLELRATSYRRVWRADRCGAYWRYSTWEELLIGKEWVRP